MIEFHRFTRLLMQHSMHEGHRNRAFADRRRDPLDVSSSHVADRKHTRQAGLEQMRRAGEWPTRRGQIVGREVRTSLDESRWVERDAAVEPPCVGNGSRHDEHVADVMRLNGPGLRVPAAYPLKMLTAF